MKTLECLCTEHFERLECRNFDKLKLVNIQKVEVSTILEMCILDILKNVFKTSYFETLGIQVFETTWPHSCRATKGAAFGRPPLVESSVAMKLCGSVAM